MAILAISHVMKSTGYEHQNHKFRVFRQSLQVSQVRAISKLGGRYCNISINQIMEKILKWVIHAVDFIWRFEDRETLEKVEGDVIVDFPHEILHDFR